MKKEIFHELHFIQVIIKKVTREYGSTTIEKYLSLFDKSDALKTSLMNIILCNQNFSPAIFYVV